MSTDIGEELIGSSVEFATVSRCAYCSSGAVGIILNWHKIQQTAFLLLTACFWRANYNYQNQ